MEPENIYMVPALDEVALYSQLNDFKIRNLPRDSVKYVICVCVCLWDTTQERGQFYNFFKKGLFQAFESFLLEFLDFLGEQGHNIINYSWGTHFV